jgi:hypothetical protein
MKVITWRDLTMVSISNSTLCKLSAGHDCIICILQFHVVWFDYISYHNVVCFRFFAYMCLVIL